jgi:hypothetical protein
MRGIRIQTFSLIKKEKLRVEADKIIRFNPCFPF